MKSIMYFDIKAIGICNYTRRFCSELKEWVLYVDFLFWGAVHCA